MEGTVYQPVGDGLLHLVRFQSSVRSSENVGWSHLSDGRLIPPWSHKTGRMAYNARFDHGTNMMDFKVMEAPIQNHYTHIYIYIQYMYNYTINYHTIIDHLFELGEEIHVGATMVHFSIPMP